MVKGANQVLLLVLLITYSLLHLVHMMVVLSLVAGTDPLLSPCPSLDPQLSHHQQRANTWRAVR